MRHKIEKVPRFATRLVPDLRGLNYEERLKKLDLTILKDPRNRGDMTTTYKILRGIGKVDNDSLFQMRASRTRGHKWKLERQMSRRNVRKYSYPLRVVNKWNALRKEVAEATSIHNFKGSFDKNNDCLNSEALTQRAQHG
ncbi:uncharacterized protein [Procambarus clarkii]|uniref:uncharacterized protein n=1 Tax=Procambarus clarkii TaxID=6728 RepID=UPI003742FA9D